LLPQDGITGGALMPIAEYLAGFGYTYLTSYTDFISDSDLVWVGNALFAKKS